MPGKPCEAAAQQADDGRGLRCQRRIRRVCVRGAGVGSFYHFHVHNDLREGRLVHVLPDYEMQARNLYAVIPHRNFVRPQVKAFIDFVRRFAATATGVAAGNLVNTKR